MRDVSLGFENVYHMFEKETSLCLLLHGRYIWVMVFTKSEIHGWILAKFLFCVFMDRNGVEVYKQVKIEKYETNILPSRPNKLGQ